nr:MAG TPA: hypothetical protein [Caudoviricetes sp.]
MRDRPVEISATCTLCVVLIPDRWRMIIKITFLYLDWIEFFYCIIICFNF